MKLFIKVPINISNLSAFSDTESVCVCVCVCVCVSQQVGLSVADVSVADVQLTVRFGHTARSVRAH